MDVHWILIIVGVLCYIVAVGSQLANMRHMQRTFSFNYLYLGIAVVTGLGGSLSLLIGLIYLIADVVKS